MNPTVFCMGDEDRAAGHASKAYSLFAAGVQGTMLDDYTVINNDFRNGVSYIESPFHAPISIFLPTDDPVVPDAYRMERLGCSHRKDAMLPRGTYDITTFLDATINLPMAPEYLYVSDGILILAMVGTATATPEDWLRRDFTITLSIAGVTEDLTSNQANVKNAQGFSAIYAGTYFSSVSVLQGRNYFSVCPYGVDRTGAYPKYIAIAGFNILTTGTPITQTYLHSGETVTLTYLEVYQAFMYLRAGREFTTDSNAYAFAYDAQVVSHDYATTNANDFNSSYESAPFPIIVPLGNMGSVAIYRQRSANAGYLLGGTFSLGAAYISGDAFDTTGISTTGITGGWWTGASFNFGTPGGSFVSSQDSIRCWKLMRSFADTCRTAVPVSSTETLLFGYKTTDDNQATTQKWICYSVTATSISEKGTVASFYDDFKDPEYPAGTPRTRHKYIYIGACHLGGTKVVAYFNKFTATNGATTFSFTSRVRMLSTDDGVTWSEAATSFTDANYAGDYPYLPPRPLYIGESASGSIVAFAATEQKAITGGYACTNLKLTTSENDGLDFTASASGAGPTFEYSMDFVNILVHTSNTIMTPCLTGDDPDGFEPSPYRHLPTYYGTPTKACRDASNDEGL